VVTVQLHRIVVVQRPGVHTHEAAQRRIILPRPQMVVARRRVELLPGVQIAVIRRPLRGGQCAVGIVGVLVRDRPGEVGQQPHGSLRVVQVVLRSRAVILRDHLVVAAQIAPGDGAARVRFEDHITVGGKLVPQEVGGGGLDRLACAASGVADGVILGEYL
jgi:hypothetical protein